MTASLVGTSNSREGAVLPLPPLGLTCYPLSARGAESAASLSPSGSCVLLSPLRDGAQVVRSSCHDENLYTIHGSRLGGGKMATLAQLQERLPSFKQEYFSRNRFVDEYRKTEYCAAVKIQSWFRGCKVRAYIRYLNKMMVFIQKWWRGYQGRKMFRKMAETAYFIMKMNFYNEMAVRIAGIYNSPCRKSPDPWEMQLKKAKPLKHKKKKIENAMDLPWHTYAYSFGFQVMPPLPPIGRQKPQGPFRDTVEVLRQRFKPLEPSVRVVASSSSLRRAQEKEKQEEWRNRIHDEAFMPFSYNVPDEYIPSIQRASEYGQSDYGIKHFREEHPEKWITNKDFLTMLPSIPLFGKFGQAYSRAGQFV
ncbi:spermatogenesis-associated protein 17 isoform 2-T2 [Liasis olivaceus]